MPATTRSAFSAKHNGLQQNTDSGQAVLSNTGVLIMGFTIFTREQVTPREIISHGALRDELVLNEGLPPVYPAGSSVFYTPSNLDIYSSDPTVRRVLLNDPNGTATDSDVLAAFPGLRDNMAANIRIEGSHHLLALAAPYSPEERETWIQQQREAEEWLVNNSAAAPMVRAMAAARGITVAELVSRIMENVNLFRAAAGQVLGIQQGLIDRIYTTGSVTELLSITWP